MKTVEQLYNDRKAAVQAMQLASNAAPEMEEKLRIVLEGSGNVTAFDEMNEDQRDYLRVAVRMAYLDGRLAGYMEAME